MAAPGLIPSGSISPGAMLGSLWTNRTLLKLLIGREIVGRYKGSVMGLMWSLFYPLLMLAVYTFVFSVVFQARWGVTDESKTQFALVLFAGLMVYVLFSECLNRAPTLILSNVNYVKKVVFPLEILPWVSLGAALFHLGVSFIVWLGAFLVLFGVPPATALLFPVILAPLLMLVMGASWLLASLGVYVRDVTQIISVLTSTLLFLTPIFYPIEILPKDFQFWLMLNPLTHLVGWVRDVLIWGRTPDWALFGWFTFASLAVMWLSFVWFQKTRKGFADVL
ncbi:MAG: ABC transporter permease [Rhodospirillaceae bacterium]|nr:ABC transporter permease [Rhodospirillaceae bacterium]